MSTTEGAGAPKNAAGHAEHPPSTSVNGRMSTAPTAPRKPPARLVKLTSPLARRLAGRRWFPLWAVLHHRGRQSGREYAIPVAVITTPTSFVIGLPWGPQTNWARNVMAAGGCVVRWKARDYRATEPRLVGPDVAVAAANPLEGWILRRAGLKNFLELQRTPAP